MLLANSVVSESGVKNIRMAKVGGKDTLVTHRDPTNGYLWCEDVKVREGNDMFLGAWVAPEKVSFS